MFLSFEEFMKREFKELGLDNGVEIYQDYLESFISENPDLSADDLRSAEEALQEIRALQIENFVGEGDEILDLEDFT